MQISAAGPMAQLATKPQQLEEQEPPARKRNIGETLVGAGVPGLVGAAMSYTGALGMKAVMPNMKLNPLMFAAIGGAMGVWQGVKHLNKVAKDPSVTNPVDTGRSRGEAIRDGALVGAATLGITVASIMGARAGFGAALAGGGPTRIAAEVAKKALPWAAAAGVAGGGLGAAFGATLREPDAAINSIRDRTLGSAKRSAMWGGGIGLVGGAAIAGLASKSVGKAAVAGGVGAAAGALMLGTAMLGYNFLNNTSATWANAPKR